MNSKRIFCFLAGLFVTVAMSTEGQAATPASGDDGNIHWDLNADGVLTISKIEGATSGSMSEKLNPQGYPWYSFGESVTGLVIQEGVTSITNYAFMNMNNVSGEIVIPSGVTSVGYAAFAHMGSVESLVIPNSVETIGGNAFDGMWNLMTLVVPDGATMNTSAFQVARPSELTISADQLQAYLSAGGGFRDGVDITIICKNGSNCQEEMEDWIQKKYIDRGYPQPSWTSRLNYTVASSNSSSTGGGNGTYAKKRIYTVEEAERVSKPTGNRIMLRYK